MEFSNADGVELLGLDCRRVLVPLLVDDPFVGPSLVVVGHLVLLVEEAPWESLQLPHIPPLTTV